MTNALSPRTRASIINYDPTQPNALSVSEFCKSLKISRSVFYKIRARAAEESAAALHPRSRAPIQPARRYGKTVINELVRIRRQLRSDGWDYGPRSIYYEATQLGKFPGDRIPSAATIARLLSSVGQVDASPKKRPRSSYVPFARSTVMALWQLDAFEYRLTDMTLVTIYQLLDDATRFDVGTTACQRPENSADAKRILEQAITQFGAPQELLSDNSSAFNQLRQGRIGAVEVFLASKGVMPITGLPGKPTTQGKNERSHQTLTRFLDANPSRTLEQLHRRIEKFRAHYNYRRPHQALRQATPGEAWELLEHTPATEPVPLAVLEARAAEYRSKRRLVQQGTYRADLVVMKDGTTLQDAAASSLVEQSANEAIVETTKENHQVYFHGLCVKLPVKYGNRQFFRTITDDEFLLVDPRSGEVVFSFPLPLAALRVQGRYVNSYAIRGVFLAEPGAYWQRKYEACQVLFAERGDDAEQLFIR